MAREKSSEETLRTALYARAEDCIKSGQPLSSGEVLRLSQQLDEEVARRQAELLEKYCADNKEK